MRGAIRPLPDGGTAASGEGEYAAFSIYMERDYDGDVYDAKGYRVGRVAVVSKRPKTPAIAQANIDKARERMAVCAGCDNAKSVTTEKHGMPVYAVKCKAAGRCANVSLISGRCPARKW